MEPNVTTTPTVTTRSAGIRYGVIGGLISIVYFLVLTTAGVDMSQGIGRWAGLIITIVIIFLAHKYYKDNGDGFMSYGQGIGIGFWIGLVSAVISSIFTYIYAKFIDPSFITTIREKAIADMEAQGSHNHKLMRRCHGLKDLPRPNALLFLGLFFGVLITVVIALIISIFTQKPQPEQSI